MTEENIFELVQDFTDLMSSLKQGVASANCQETRLSYKAVNRSKLLEQDKGVNAGLCT